jgi:hypothetical protein
MFPICPSARGVALVSGGDRWWERGIIYQADPRSPYRWLRLGGAHRQPHP